MNAFFFIARSSVSAAEQCMNEIVPELRTTLTSTSNAGANVWPSREALVAIMIVFQQMTAQRLTGLLLHNWLGADRSPRPRALCGCDGTNAVLLHNGCAATHNAAHWLQRRRRRQSSVRLFNADRSV
jgi:hypothetical protein